MSDPNSEPGAERPVEAPAAPEQPPANLSQLLIDLGPIAIFVVAYNVLNRIRPDDAIYISTGVFIVSTLAAIAFSWFRTRKIPPILIVTGVLVTAFGGLTIVLHDENFMKFKPTAMYLFYAAAVFGSLLFGQNIWKLLFQHTFVLPDRIWRILAMRWAAFFILLAALNEAIRLWTSTDFWVNARILIFFPLILLFGAVNAPLMLKYAGRSEEDPAQTPRNHP